MVGAGTYSLLETLWWSLKGQWMYYFYVHIFPHVQAMWMLPDFSPGPPQWWLDSYYYPNGWNDHIQNGKPDIIFVLLYRAAAKDRYSDWVARAADNVARPLVDAVSNLLGSLAHSYTTFSSWLEALRGRVGTWIPDWTSNLATGLNYLKMKLPQSIFSYPYTWDSIWEDIKTAVKDWARSIYDAAKDWVANHAPWVIDWINFLATWYDAVGVWINTFKNDPYGTVAGWLGVAWIAWTGIRVDIVDFYNTVWSPFKVTLHDFLADPLGWMYDRVEDELIRRW